VLKFPGTLFRFPLRTHRQAQESPISSSLSCLESLEIERQFTGQFGNQARESLVFLNNICCLQFWRRGFAKDHPFELYWSVCVESKGGWTEADPEPNSPLENLRLKEMAIIHSKPSSSSNATTSIWTIVSGSIRQAALPPTTPLVEKIKTRRSLTVTDQSLHAIPDVAMATNRSLSILRTGHYYNSLPTPSPTGLPVHCHARFSTTADRRSLRIDGDSGQWNRFLAAQCFPHMYFFLLEVLALQAVTSYYSFWPMVRVEDTITSALQSTFWKKLPGCTKRIIQTSNNHAYQLDRVIFDTREMRQGKDSADWILQFVKLMLPESHIVHQPPLNRALFSSDFIARDHAKACPPNLQSLSPLFVRRLLQLPESVAVLSTLDDSALRSIIDFTLEDGPSDNFIGCYGLRSANEALFKLERIETSKAGKVVSVIDETGFRLFKETHGNTLLKPSFLSDKASKIFCEAQQQLNVRRINGLDIDRFLEHIFPSRDIQQVPAQQKDWLSALWSYIFAKDFQVSFYKTRPTIGLQSAAQFHFASLNGLEAQPIMPPYMPTDLRGLCEKIPGLFILTPSKLADVTASAAKWDGEERFLHCLRKLMGGEPHRLTQILRPCLDTSDLLVIFRCCTV
jgi:hypothetical protein